MKKLILSVVLCCAFGSINRLISNCSADNIDASITLRILVENDTEDIKKSFATAAPKHAELLLKPQKPTSKLESKTLNHTKFTLRKQMFLKCVVLKQTKLTASL